ncbi:MAG: dienelactone hydrolase family protein [Chloroherpetonaceae bacterium]|nr:dienelactone hydrolase family protein [Chthonomonadaceae bacterium]MDW8206221.1 dienelactone hydrolase family protein [Chloroherpetonaceae bacterium]
MSASAQSAPGTELPATDTRAVVPPRTLNTHRTFPQFRTLEEWQARRAFIRQHMLVSLGLYPLPPRTPLRARIFGRVERDGYTIEKVYFQTHPGFYLAGNLYRPRPGSRFRPGNGPYPGVLVAHGHWGNGRMANQPEGSIAARAITFARQGYVAFTYDMVGYNDTRQFPEHRAIFNTLRDWAWGVSLMGLQTWNSMRALDFLASLPDVDRTRLAITGESGGGTQTMILGALDDRLAAVAPCVMVSHTMQGGCLCENAPGLRVDFSNVEIAAAAAPRYQILVGATGDWTATTNTMEGPSIASIYRLFGRPENLQYVLFDYGHNINQTSREAVYAFFGRKLLGLMGEESLREPPYQMEPVEKLRVFPDGAPLPASAVTQEQLRTYLIDLARKDLERHRPRDRRSLERFQQRYRPMWQHTLNVEIPQRGDLIAQAAPSVQEREVLRVTRLRIGRRGRGDSLPAVLFLPNGGPTYPAVVLTDPKGKSAFLTPDNRPGEFAQAFLRRGHAVLVLDLFLTGELADPAAEQARKRPFGEFFSTYNRTNLQERVQDLITASAYLRSRGDIRSVALVGTDAAGLWALLAAPAADIIAADCARMDLSTDEPFLSEDLFAPGIRRMGDFQTVAFLTAPRPLLLHNTGDRFLPEEPLAGLYARLKLSDRFRFANAQLSTEAIAEWVARQAPGAGL